MCTIHASIPCASSPNGRHTLAATAHGRWTCLLCAGIIGPCAAWCEPNLMAMYARTQQANMTMQMQGLQAYAGPFAPAVYAYPAGNYASAGHYANAGGYTAYVNAGHANTAYVCPQHGTITYPPWQ